MDAKKFENYMNVLKLLVKFKQEQNIIDQCLNTSVEQSNVQVYIGSSNFVIINWNFILKN